MAKISFSAAGIEPQAPRNYEPLPAGAYEMMVIDSTTKQTKSGDGWYLELSMQVISGPHSGRRHWERLNLSNPNKTAEDIAKAAMASLCLAIGKPDVEDSEELHDLPFMARVEIDRKDPTRNRITGYLSVQNPLANANAPARQAPAASAAPAKSARPWG